MSREFKFRAWDKATKKIYKVDSLNFRNKDLWLKVDDNKIIGANFFEVELMQYTGLKDKNGKEIYEGDIIQFVGEGYKANGVVKYGIRRPKMINENNELGFYVGWSSELCWRRDLIFWSRKCEVIGNIYKNPELMWRSEGNVFKNS